MGTYIKEFSPIEVYAGNRIMTMLISLSFGTSVYFEIYGDGNDWKIYWNFEIHPNEFLPVMKKYAKPGMMLLDAMEDQTIISKVRELSHTFSKDLSSDEVALIKDVISKGFPELTRRKPQGLDGHSYIFTLDSDDTEYSCWCVIPEEWAHIVSAIDLVVDIAGLDDNYRIDGIY